MDSGGFSFDPGDSPNEVFKELRKKEIKEISTVAIELVPEDLIVWLS